MRKNEQPILRPCTARLPDGRQVVRATREIAFIVPSGVAAAAALGDFVAALIEAAADESGPDRPARSRRHEPCRTHLRA